MTSGAPGAPAAAPTPGPRTVLVVGAGLVGTSVALALRRAGERVLLDDRDRARRDLAVALDAGEAWAGERVDHAVVAVPPSVVPVVLAGLQQREVAATYTDCASVKSTPQREVESSGMDAGSFCGGHPIAGRERSGPAAARDDLFVGRAWVLTPTEETRWEALEQARATALACGASVTVMAPQAHDRALARVSHVPQLVASLLAARLLDDAEGAAGLAGQGMRDTTRIAGSDPALWADIVARNAGPVAAVLDELRHDLDRLRDALDPARSGRAGDDTPLRDAVTDLLRRGNEGRARLPGKHGGLASPFAVVPVVVADEPGTLARLFSDCAATGISVEDLHLEHATGRPRGVAELLVQPEHAVRLAERLAERGWSVHLPAGGATV